MNTNKKDKVSFADSARKLQQKYSRAKWDKLEQEGLEREMEMLMQEQENARAQLGLNEQPQQQVQQFGLGGPEDPEVQDINNPNQYPNGKIYQDNRGWMERGLDRLYGSYETYKPQLLKDFPILDTPGMMLQYVTGNVPSDGNVQGGNLLVGSPKVKGNFSPSWAQLRSAKALNTRMANKEAKLMNELINAPGNLAKEYPLGVRNLSDLSGKTSTSVPLNIPWKNIGYGAAGATGLGLGIYGLTQLSDGTIVDKQGNPVNPNNVTTIDSKGNVIDKFGNINKASSYSNSPYLYGNGIPPIIDPKYAPSTLKFNNDLLTDQQVKSGVKGGGVGNKGIKQDLVTPEYLTPEQAALGIEKDIRNSNTFSPESLNFHSKTPLYTGLEYDKLKTYAAGQQSKAEDINKSGFWDKNKQYLPYAISGLSNIAGNLLLANMAKKNVPKVSASLATPERMNLEPQAEQLKKDAVVSKNIGMRQARDLGLNAGATLANMGAIGSGVDRQLGSNLTNLYGQQEQFNVGTANQFNLQNQEAINRANLINSQYQAQGNQDRLNYLSGALGTIPGVMKDIRMDRADKEMRGIMDAYYKSSGGKNYLAVGSIFDTEFGKYVVKGHNPDGTPITEKVKK